MITNERQLADEAVKNDMWLDAAIEVVTGQGEVDVDEQAYMYGVGMADLVATGSLKLADLRHDASVYNYLDREAVEAGRGDIEQLADSADYLEAMSRRIGHQAMRHGLELVKTDRRRDIHFRRYLERHGMSLVGIREQGTLEARK